MAISLGFGSGSITQSDWNWIEETCKTFNIKNIIEIGSGFSTICFSKVVESIDSYETYKSFIDYLKQNVDSEKVNFIFYRYPIFQKVSKAYDLAFVDGPGQQFNFDGRLSAMLFVKPLANKIFIHDCSRKKEKISIENIFNKNEWTFTKKSNLLLVERI